jgi:hypothetical protein
VQEIRLETLGDLGSNHAIYALCNACNRSTRLNADRLAAVYGLGLRIDELKRRLACSKCGERTREIRIVYAVPTRS